MRARFMMCAVAGLCLVACYEEKEPTTSAGYLGKGGFGYVCDLGAVDECKSGTVPIPSSVAVGSTFSIRYEAETEDGYDSKSVLITSGTVESVGTHLSSTSRGTFKALSAGPATLVIRGVNHDLLDYHPLNIADVEALVLESFSNDRDQVLELLSTGAAKSVVPGIYGFAIFPTTKSGEKLSGLISYDATSSDDSNVSVETVDGRNLTLVARALGDATVTVSGSQTSFTLDIKVTGETL